MFRPVEVGQVGVGASLFGRPGAEGGAQGAQGGGVTAGIGGVLGHVGGYGLVGEFGVGAEGGDLAHVELFAPAEFAFPDRIRFHRDADPLGVGAGGLGEYGDGGVRRWGLAAAVRVVESDDGVEVDQGRSTGAARP